MTQDAQSLQRMSVLVGSSVTYSAPYLMSRVACNEKCQANRALATGLCSKDFDGKPDVAHHCVTREIEREAVIDRSCRQRLPECKLKNLGS
jgi:hypothetical protein